MLAPLFDPAYRLSDRYSDTAPRIFISGTQALVRIAMAQRWADRAAGLNTAGLITGYRGSPLGGVDKACWEAREQLEGLDVRFVPAVNEELAATIALGTQQVESEPGRTVDGVFALWYGKGPGLDRAGDALKHGNALGSSPCGGVLVVAGDDHGCVSSSMAHQSDQAFAAWSMPVLHPASVGEYVHFGLYGIALSRFSGLWCGFKAVTQTVESAVSVNPGDAARGFSEPEGFVAPPGGLHYRWSDGPTSRLEERLAFKLAAARAFAAANPIDRVLGDTSGGARFGIVTVGKAHGDTMEALRKLGLDETALRTSGIRILKVGLVWPIETGIARSFASGLERLLVVEEKAGVVEGQLRALFYDAPAGRRPEIVGKCGPDGQALVPATGELSPALIAPLLVRAGNGALDAALHARLANRLQRLEASAAMPALPTAEASRSPYFCSGCPHSSSTVVPQGSRAMTGIGCHYMAAGMERATSGLVQMGGEGANWVGVAPFTRTGHMFQNLGDGTYFHSGLLAIRQAVAAGINITYKILYNDAVAMTGGQPLDGQLSVADLLRQLLAEGVVRVALVSDAPERHAKAALPSGVTVRHRDGLMTVQRSFREIPGTTAIVYEQTCAAEKRRRAKRAPAVARPTRVVINERVCEGCGDCTVQSNCLSVVPVETRYGRKRQIDQASCNTDYSCLKGFCPSFVTIEGAGPPATVDRVGEVFAAAEDLEEPAAGARPEVAEILLAGVGGTGVVTAAALLAMAAHLEGRAASTLDFTGFAQKGGIVLSHVRIAGDAGRLHQVRIDRASADLVIACDAVAATSDETVRTMRHAHTRVVWNSHVQPVAAGLRDPDHDIGEDALAQRMARTAGRPLAVLDAQALAEGAFGDATCANVLLLGFAFQNGWLPVTGAALSRAIALNAVAVERNRAAFAMGRLAAAAPGTARRLAGMADEEADRSEDLDTLIDGFTGELEAYQDAAYAEAYRSFIAQVRQREEDVAPSPELPLTGTVARVLFALMAYKDEYEVARLLSDAGFIGSLEQRFGDGAKPTFHLAPPLLAPRDRRTGRPRKLAFGRWVVPVMKGLARLKRLRGTPFDPFGHTAERRMERALIAEYRAAIETVLAGLTPSRLDEAVAIAGLARAVRGYGPVKAAAAADYRVRLAERLRRYTERPAFRTAA